MWLETFPTHSPRVMWNFLAASLMGSWSFLKSLYLTILTRGLHLHYTGQTRREPGPRHPSPVLYEGYI